MADQPTGPAASVSGESTAERAAAAGDSNAVKRPHEDGEEGDRVPMQQGNSEDATKVVETDAETAAFEAASTTTHDPVGDGDAAPARKRSKWVDSDDEEEEVSAGSTPAAAGGGGGQLTELGSRSAEATPTGGVTAEPAAPLTSIARRAEIATGASSGGSAHSSAAGAATNEPNAGNDEGGDGDGGGAKASSAQSAADPASEGPISNVGGEDAAVDEDAANKGAEDDVADEEEVYFPALSGCRSINEFNRLNKIEEGTYGEVFRVEDAVSKEVLAVKRFKLQKEDSGFPITALREINTLLKCKHQNIVAVREILVGSTQDHIFVAMEFVEHDMKSLLETMTQPFLAREVKCLMQQLLEGVHHLHHQWILHRDLKTSNLLMSHRGILKIADFGLAREYGSPLKNYTQLVVTLWYRSPELLLGTKTYSTEVDMWSVGCIFAELLTQKALFPAKTEIESLNKIFQMLGTPNERVWEGYDQLPHVQKWAFKEYPKSHWRKNFAFLTEEGFRLLEELLLYDPAKRISASEALDHKWFVEKPLPVAPEDFPHWPAKSEGEKKTRRSAESPAAPGGRVEAGGPADDDEYDDGGAYVMEAEARGAIHSGAAGFTLNFG